MADSRFEAASGVDVFTGNELILKGALEAGVGLITGYPGSPVAYVFNAAFSNRDLLKTLKVAVQIANNEALSGSRLHGASLGPIRAMAVFKSVGMHVASDSLALGNLAEPNESQGGRLVVVGDDPWNSSTQTNSDSRYLSQHLFMPVMEPGTFQELKDWLEYAFEISGQTNLYITYLVETDLADGGSNVTLYSNRPSSWRADKSHTLDSQEVLQKNLVTLPPVTDIREETLASRHKKVLELARNKFLNKIFYERHSTLGFVTAGLSYLHLKEALRGLGLSGKFPILKLGITYPIDSRIVLELASHVNHIIVVEQRRGFMETQIVEILNHAKQEGFLKKEVKVWGKKFPENLSGVFSVHGLNPSRLEEILIPLFLKWLPQLDHLFPIKRHLEERKNYLDNFKVTISLSKRTPTFCPGCPHRDSTSVLLGLKKDVIFHGDTGCYSMLTFPPNQGLMMNYVGMGLGGGTGAGIDPFIKNKQVVFVGDGTFFHSGMVAISDSLKNNQDITYIILDNKTTAMTGHQPHAGDDVDILGNPTYAQNIQMIVEALAPTQAKIFKVDPNDHPHYRKVLEEVILSDGVKVVIADKECGITFQRKVKATRQKVLEKKGYVEWEKAINITSEVCEYCMECTKATGCPGLTIEDTDFGPKIATDLSLCVADGACSKGTVCPSFEEVTIVRKGPSLRGEKLRSLLTQTNPPEPKLPQIEDYWRCYLCGIGGQGMGLLSALLVRAAKEEGFNVSFADKKGLAIRNGAVFSHIVFSRTNDVVSPVIAYGKADCVLGMDLLETARALDTRYPIRVISPQNTSCVVSTAKNPTILNLMGEDDFDPQQLVKTLKKYSKFFWGEDLSGICEDYFGTGRYLNCALLGAAYQLGLIPIASRNLKNALAATVRPHEIEENERAFELGRRIVFNKELFLKAQDNHDPEVLIQEKLTYLSKRNQQEFLRLTERSRNALRNITEGLMYHVNLRIYDLINYDNVRLAESYLDRVIAVYVKDLKDYGFEATGLVIRYLHKVLAIKDEIYVAHLLMSPEKLRRDIERYQIDPARGDKLLYTHFNRPEFVIWGKRFAFDIKTKNWMLQIMKRLKFLRKFLPQWHAQEKEFRKFYEKLVDAFAFNDKKTYELYCELLKIPEEVGGYREIRYPKMQLTQDKARKLLDQTTLSANASGLAFWDAKTVSGENVVSGVYENSQARGGEVKLIASL